jgi:hypothetical protein
MPRLHHAAMLSGNPAAKIAGQRGKAAAPGIAAAAKLAGDSRAYRPKGWDGRGLVSLAWKLHGFRNRPPGRVLCRCPAIETEVIR